MSTIGPTITDNEDASRLWRVYESVSKNIERENALISFRISWAIFLTAGIVAAETFIASYVKDFYSDQPSIQIAAQLVILALSGLGGYFCARSRVGVRAAQSQMEHVKDCYFLHETSLRLLGYPRPFGSSDNHNYGNYNASAFPFALLLLWIALFAAQAGRLYMIWSDPTASKVSETVRLQSPEFKRLESRLDEIKAFTSSSNAQLVADIRQNVDALSQQVRALGDQIKSRDQAAVTQVRQPRARSRRR